MVVEIVVQIVRDIVAAIAATTGAVVAIVGLQTWRRQLRGSAELETARSVLRASYKMRDAIQTVLLASHLSEFFGPVKEEEVRQALLRRHTENWVAVQDARSELQIAELEGEVLWGKSFKTALQQLKECMWDLSAAHDEYLRYRESETPHRTQSWRSLGQLLKERTERQTSEPFQRKVETAIKSLENFVRPRIELRS